MRVVKSLQQGLLSNPFTFRQQHYLGIATLIPFELGVAGSVLTEQQLWQQLLPILENERDLILDLALPKEQGEWLLYGAACSPSARPCVRVSAAVAGVEKTLDVYGEREWLTNGRASEPRLFQRQSLRWQSTFGGPTHADNPQGCNQQRPASVFYPQQAPIYRDQIVPPACFLPLAFDHPSRICYQGSYGEAWLQEQWPGYPDDLDWRYFNVAPLDQRFPGFFQANDSYYLVNLHPEQPQISGQLPGCRPRAFIEYQQGKLSELSLRCDTVWLFPEQLLGVVIYHGIAPIDDDEALDVKQILLGLEAAGSVPLTAADYLAQSRYDAVEAEMNPPWAAEAEKQLLQAEKTVQDIPKLLQFKKDQISGQAPTPQAGLLEQQEIAQQQLERHLEMLAKTRSWLATQPVSAEVLASVDNSCAQLAKMQQRLGELPAQLALISQQVDDATQRVQQTVSLAGEPLSPPQESTLTRLVDFSALEKSWQAQAGRLISLAQQGIADTSPQEELPASGLRLLTQQRYLLGYLPQPIPFIPEEWALTGPAEREMVGPGWLLPEFQGALFTALTIRPGALSDPTGEYRVQGSHPEPWCSGRHPDRAIVIVPELLLGWRLAQDVDHWVDLLLLPTPETALDPALSERVEQAPLILLPLTAEQSIIAWQQRFPQAQPLWIGDYSDLQARLDADVNQCQWLATALPQELIPPDRPEPDPAAFMEATVERIGSQSGSADPLAIETFIQQQLQELQPTINALPESVQTVVIPALQRLAATMPSGTPGEQLQAAKAQVQQAFDALNALKHHYPEWLDTPVINTFQPQIEALLQQTEQLLSEGMAKLPQPEDQPPQQAYRTLDREQLKAAYQSGESLVRVNLSGVNLSGLSLVGIDLSESLLNNCNLSHCDLRRARLVGVVANKACFTGACLQQAECQQALLSEADLSQINGTGCQLTEALLRGAQLTEANLTQAQLSDVIAEKATAQRIALRQADLTDSIWLGADLTAADLTEAQVTRIIMNEAILIDSCWHKASGQAANLWGVSATRANFTCARLPNARFGPACLVEAQLAEAELPHTNFLKATATAANFSGGNLYGTYMDRSECAQADFSWANLRDAQLLRCNFTEAKFLGADAMEASLSKSCLVAADCREFNLFNANLRKIVIGKTQFSGANLQRTLLKHYQELADDP